MITFLLLFFNSQNRKIVKKSISYIQFEIQGGIELRSNMKWLENF